MDSQPTQDQQHSNTTHTHTILDRLVEQYLARTTVPGTHTQALTIERFHRLYCCIMTEGYGQ